MDYLEKLKKDMLDTVHLTELPDEVNEETKLWVRAIALIRKQSGDYGYAVLERYPDITYRYLMVNGATSPIKSTEKIYPYLLLDKKYIKGFKGNGLEQRVAYLKSMHLPYERDRKWDEMNLTELNKEIVGAAIYLQLQDLKSK